jgi:hypothetical protein
VLVGGPTGDRHPHAHDIGGRDLRRQGETGDVVERVDGEHAAGESVRRRHESRGPVAAATPSAGEARAADDTLAVERHDADRGDRAQRPGNGGTTEHCVERIEFRGGAEGLPPVHDGRRRRRDVDDEIERAAAEMDEI